MEVTLSRISILTSCLNTEYTQPSWPCEIFAKNGEGDEEGKVGSKSDTLKVNLLKEMRRQYG